MVKRSIFILSLSLFISCNQPVKFDDAFEFYYSYELKESCIRRLRNDGHIYEYRFGGRRVLFKKEGSSYIINQPGKFQINEIDSITKIFISQKAIMDRLGIVEICPTYQQRIVFKSTAKVLPEEIKMQINDKKIEVAFYEKTSTYVDATTFMPWNKNWYYRIE